MFFISVPMVYGHYYWQDTTALDYTYSGNDNDGSGYTGASKEDSLKYSDNKYVYVVDKWAKEGDLMVGADDFSGPPSSITVKKLVRFYNKWIWMDFTYYRSNIDTIEYYAEIMTDVSIGAIDARYLQIRAVSNNGYCTPWVTIDQYPNDGITYDSSNPSLPVVLHKNDYLHDKNYQNFFNNIRSGTDYIEKVEVRYKETDREDDWCNLYLNIYWAYVKYYES